MAELTMQDVLNYIDQMTVLQLHEMTEALKEKYGVTAAAPMMMGPAAAGPEAPVQEEQTEFTVVLLGAGDKKIQVIKEIRAMTNLGLKEAKALVDGAPATVKEGVSKEEAQEMKAKIEEAGGTVDIK